MIWRAVVLMALLSLICACASRPAKHIYVLNQPLESAMDTDPTARDPVLQLKHVRVPDYLDTSDIQVRAGEHELRSSSTGRWAERLSLGITHALLADLAAELPAYAIRLSEPSQKSAAVIMVSVERFEVWPDGHCILAANWTIIEREGETVLTTGSNTVNIPPAVGANSEDGRVVSGMADAVRKLAGAIGYSVSASVPPSPPAAR